MINIKTGVQATNFRRISGLTKWRRDQNVSPDVLFSNLGEGVITIDKQGRIERVNKSATNILGCKASDLVGKPFYDTIRAVKADGTPISKSNRPISKSLYYAKTVSKQSFYKRLDGSIVPVFLSVAPVIVQGESAGAIQIFRDITPEIQIDKLKSEFISLASHQLRTPLSAINTYTHLLAEGYGGDLNKNQKAFTDIILSSVNRMNKLINTLLNVTRVEAGTITVSPKSTDICRLAKDLVKEFRAEAHGRKINLQIVTSPDLPKVHTDSLLVKEVISNLLSNSIKYTPENGQVQVSIYMKSQCVICKISDNGYGIPSSAKRFIFSKFFRAHNVAALDVGGTGLGLYLIKIIVDNLGGKLWFVSSENKGTTFYLSLPVDGVRAKRGKFRLETL